MASIRLVSLSQDTQNLLKESAPKVAAYLQAVLKEKKSFSIFQSQDGKVNYDSRLFFSGLLQDETSLDALEEVFDHTSFLQDFNQWMKDFPLVLTLENITSSKQMIDTLFGAVSCAESFTAFWQKSMQQVSEQEQQKFRPLIANAFAYKLLLRWSAFAYESIASEQDMRKTKNLLALATAIFTACNDDPAATYEKVTNTCQTFVRQEVDRVLGVVEESTLKLLERWNVVYTHWQLIALGENGRFFNLMLHIALKERAKKLQKENKDFLTTIGESILLHTIEYHSAEFQGDSLKDESLRILVELTQAVFALTNIKEEALTKEDPTTKKPLITKERYQEFLQVYEARAADLAPYVSPRPRLGSASSTSTPSPPRRVPAGTESSTEEVRSFRRHIKEWATEERSTSLPPAETGDTSLRVQDKIAAIEKKIETSAYPDEESVSVPGQELFVMSPRPLRASTPPRTSPVGMFAVPTSPRTEKDEKKFNKELQGAVRKRSNTLGSGKK